jgi:hypothetical protein
MPLNGYKASVLAARSSLNGYDDISTDTRPPCWPYVPSLTDIKASVLAALSSLDGYEASVLA